VAKIAPIRRDSGSPWRSTGHPKCLDVRERGERTLHERPRARRSGAGQLRAASPASCWARSPGLGRYWI